MKFIFKMVTISLLQTINKKNGTVIHPQKITFYRQVFLFFELFQQNNQSEPFVLLSSRKNSFIIFEKEYKLLMIVYYTKLNNIESPKISYQTQTLSIMSKFNVMNIVYLPVQLNTTTIQNVVNVRLDWTTSSIGKTWNGSDFYSFFFSSLSYIRFDLSYTFNNYPFFMSSSQGTCVTHQLGECEI